VTEKEKAVLLCNEFYELKEKLNNVASDLEEQDPFLWREFNQAQEELSSKESLVVKALKTYGDSIILYEGQPNEQVFRVSETIKSTAPVSEVVELAKARGELELLIGCGVIKYSVSAPKIELLPESIKDKYEALLKQSSSYRIKVP
tara:strand:+ start:96 stop:533 length:438 start_codon:yes stop_codon:yes gene_type:complete